MEGEKRKSEEERERFDLDVWPQQPTRARERDMRVEERQTGRGVGGGVKCSGDQIAERAIVAEMEGERETESEREEEEEEAAG